MWNQLEAGRTGQISDVDKLIATAVAAAAGTSSVTESRPSTGGTTMRMCVERLPLLDEHTVAIAADREIVWRAVLQTVGDVFARRAASAYARFVGCAQTTMSEPTFVQGGTIPGFAVAAVLPGRELLLEGRHRFATYALRFRVDADGFHSSVLTAESRAIFPGVLGGVYRSLVVGTRFHVVAVRRLLTAVQQRCTA